jgi:hypothetical protein
MKTVMVKGSGEQLADMLDEHHMYIVEMECARDNLARQKMLLAEYAIKNGLIDCLTVNVNRLKHYAR